MIHQPELTAHDIRKMVQEVGQAHLPLTADGYICTSAMLYAVLLKAASEGISIDAACRELEQSATGNTIRELLNGQLCAAQLRRHEDEINQALAARTPPQVYACGVEAALDEHNEPYYGKTPEVQAYTCRGQAKQGTARFFRIATLYVIYRQMRLTLAVAFVLPQEETPSVVSRLHQRVRALRIRMDVLYLDRTPATCRGNQGASIDKDQALRRGHQYPIAWLCPLTGGRVCCRNPPPCVTYFVA